ncbi:radial spoke head 14 homolog [Perognathus longimembris pacificus]|uniref:radial spoke head 14 homolog n=1 Tax=Perognathus longimembris pacificus TaxID=214514 RepID=UPI0020193627|nr:radial spoke head 14 homolog [Perognathus longimembris pacificus]
MTLAPSTTLCPSCLPLSNLIRLTPGAQSIVTCGLIPALVWKLQREEENIQELILDTLASCLQEDASEALNSRAVPCFKEKLLSPNENIRSKAARALMAISIPLEGKIQVWKCDVIPILVHRLRDKNMEVKANAAGALMYATVTTEGKYAALDADAITLLLELLNSGFSTKVRLNATKALTMLAEAPEGRKLLQSHIPVFHNLEKEKNESIQRAARIALKVIEWKP